MNNKTKILILGGIGAAMYFSKMKSWTYPEAAQPYIGLISETEIKHDIPHKLLGRLLNQESHFRSDAHNVGTNAQGIAQIVPRWHPDIEDPFDPYQAIPYSGKYLRTLHDHFEHWDLALAAYNYGWGNVKKIIAAHGRNGFEHLPLETRNYVTEILADVRIG